MGLIVCFILPGLRPGPGEAAGCKPAATGEGNGGGQWGEQQGGLRGRQRHDCHISYFPVGATFRRVLAFSCPVGATFRRVLAFSCPVGATFRRVCNPPGGGWGVATPAADTLPCSLFSLPAFVVGSLTRRREAAGCKPAATCHPRNGALPYSLFSLPAFFCRVANPTQGRRRVANPPQRGRATWMPAWEATGPQLGVRNPPQRRVCSPSQLPRSGGVTPPVNFHVPAGLQPAG